MIITYFRSSSYNTWDYCQQKYFLTYVLGHEDKPNAKTEVGTMTHKVLECLAGLKLGYQNTGKYYYKDDALGEVFFSESSLYDEYELTPEEVDEVNKTRLDKKIYEWDVRINYGHKRIGKKAVESLIKRSFDYYSSKSHNTFGGIEYNRARNFTWIALDHQGGIYDPRKRDIFSPEESFDIEIDKPWAKYDYLVGDKRIQGNLRIKGTIDLITKIDDETLEIVDWKCLPIETEIPTPSGWTTIGELKVNDVIFDKDGNKTKVLAKSKIKHKKCLKISFDDKTSVICDEEHIWHMFNGENKKAIDLKINDKIPVTKPINLDEKDLPIDPYVLGLWLGDGRNRCGEISSSDDFIFKEIERRGFKIGENLNEKSKKCPSRTIYGLTTKLKQLNLCNNKHIPDLYLRSSINQRLDLLRGLMDSDGNVNSKRKQAVFTNCNKRLSDDVKKLLITLGQRVNQSNINRNTNFKKNINVYPLHFRPININPFLLPRKSTKIKNWGPGKSNVRYIKKIEELDKKYFVQCIMVDSPSNTYLCTENMIPTHNTGARMNWGTGEEKTYEKLCQDDQLMLYYYAARKLFPQFKNVMFTIFFVRSGGPFSICFDDSHLNVMESRLESQFKKIQKSTLPTMLDYTHKDFKCNKLCTFFKEKVDGQSLCSYIWKENKKHGMEKVVKEYTKDNFSVGHYRNPGE